MENIPISLSQERTTGVILNVDPLKCDPMGVTLKFDPVEK